MAKINAKKAIKKLKKAYYKASGMTATDILTKLNIFEQLDKSGTKEVVFIDPKKERIF